MNVNSDLETTVKTGFESGYEKGVRDMFKLMSEICKYQEYAEPFCNNDCDNCPIAEKLLKAVEK